MNIEQHISEKNLKSVRTTGYICVVLGLCIPYVGLLLLLLGISMVAHHRRMKKELAFLRQYPAATFAQIAATLGMKQKRICSDIELGIKQKVLQFAEIDTVGDCLRYLPIPKEKAAPPHPADQLITVSCPHCGAQVTISTTRGGQCEYCDSWLVAEE